MSNPGQFLYSTTIQSRCPDNFINYYAGIRNFRMRLVFDDFKERDFNGQLIFDQARESSQTSFESCNLQHSSANNYYVEKKYR